jgi:multidrug efflux pump subunit AcrB
VKDVIVTVVAAMVLALVCMYVLLGLVFSGWGDHFPAASPSPASGSLQREASGRHLLTLPDAE